MTQYPNWFGGYAQDYFTRYLKPLNGRPGLRFLQIGAFTGDASSWLLHNVLTGEGSTLTDVDTWLGSDEPEHEPFDWADVERVYDDRTRGFRTSGRLIKFKGSSVRFFDSPRDPFDFIYIDGDHTALSVYADASNAYRITQLGGLLAFDDYKWKSGKGDESDPGPAIDNFLAVYRPKVLEQDLQVWIQR